MTKRGRLEKDGPFVILAIRILPHRWLIRHPLAY